jgi:hypothetical protein
MRVMPIAPPRYVLGLAWMLAAATAAPVGELRLEHVMNIGSEGFGPGQFKYIEDFAFSRDGYLLAADASHAWVQVFGQAGRAHDRRRRALDGA